mgnify:CR=1 FL=1
MQLSISQVVDLSVNGFVDVVVDEDIPNIKCLDLLKSLL